MIIGSFLFPNNYRRSPDDNDYIDYGLEGDARGFSKKVIACLEGIERDYDIVNGHLQPKDKHEEDN